MGHRAGPVPGDPRAREVAAAGLPDARQQPPHEPVGERPGRRRGGAGQRVRPRRQHLPRRPDAEDQRRGRQRLVLGAQRRQPHDRRRAIVDGHLKRIEPLWANFLLNCPPNRDGLLPPEIVTRLAEVGAAWSARHGAPAAAGAAARRSTSPTIRSARPPPAAPPSSPSTARTTGTPTPSGNRRARCPSR